MRTINPEASKVEIPKVPSSEEIPENSAAKTSDVASRSDVEAPELQPQSLDAEGMEEYFPSDMCLTGTLEEQQQKNNLLNLIDQNMCQQGSVEDTVHQSHDQSEQANKNRNIEQNNFSTTARQVQDERGQAAKDSYGVRQENSVLATQEALAKIIGPNVSDSKNPSAANAAKGQQSQTTLLPGAKNSKTPESQSGTNPAQASKTPSSGAEGAHILQSPPRLSLTPQQRSTLTLAMRQQMAKMDPDSLEFKNLQQWLEAMKGDPEAVPPELVALLGKDEELQTEEKEDPLHPEESKEEEGDTGKSEKSGKALVKEDPKGSALEKAVNYLANSVHRLGAKHKEGSEAGADEEIGVLAMLEAGFVQIGDQADAVLNAGLAKMNAGLRVLQNSGLGAAYCAGGSNPLKQWLGCGGNSQDAISLGMADPKGIAEKETGLVQAISTGVFQVKQGNNSLKAMNLWQVAYGAGADTLYGDPARSYLKVIGEIRALSITPRYGPEETGELSHGARVG